MDFDLGAALSEVRSRALSLAAETEPIAREMDEATYIDRRAREALRASGLARLTVPSEFGGELDVVDPVAVCVVREVLAGLSTPLHSLFARLGVAALSIPLTGAQDSRRRLLPRR